MGQSNQVHCEKGPAEAVLPSPAEEVQPVTGAANIVLLYHHWNNPLHINNGLVQHSYQISPQKTMEGSPDCWANYWYNPPHSPRTVPIQSEKKGWRYHSGPLTSSTLTLVSVTVDATELWAPARPDTGTVSSLKQSISWTFDNKRGTHNTVILYLSITHTYFSFQICTYQTCTHIIVLYYILWFCYFVHCLFVYYYFIICVLSCCCHSVALWSFCHYNKFLVCVNIPSQ